MKISLRSIFLVIFFKLSTCGKNTNLSGRCIESLEKMFKCGNVRAGEEDFKQICRVSRCMMDYNLGCSRLGRRSLVSDGSTCDMNTPTICGRNTDSLDVDRRCSEARCLYYGLVSCEPAELRDMNISEERLAEIEREYITDCS